MTVIPTTPSEEESNPIPLAPIPAPSYTFPKILISIEDLGHAGSSRIFQSFASTGPQDFLLGAIEEIYKLIFTEKDYPKQ